MNYNDLIRTVAGSAALTRKQADEAVVTVLTVLSEAVSAEETLDLLAQLPKSFRERVPASAATMPMRPIEFVARVADLNGADLGAAERNVRAVFEVLTRAVNTGELADIAAELGDGYDEWLGREPRATAAGPGPVSSPPPPAEPAIGTVSSLVAPATTSTAVAELPRPSVTSPMTDAAVGVARAAVTLATWPLRVGLRSIGRRIPLMR